VGAAKESERPMLRNTLAWALFRTGRLEEARGEEERAVAEIEGGKTREYEGYLSNLERTIAAWRGAGARSERSKEAAELASRIASLERAIGERRTFEFEGGEDRWWHAQLSKLVSDLNSFVDESTGGLCSSGTSERHGWGIVKRAEFARTIEERSVEGADAKRRWEEAIAAIERSEKYGGLRMTPQLGLLPIGMDPDSRLWEFAHLASGEPVERGSDGKLVLKESMGLVFVLIPGGTFRMGAQNTDPTGPNYDPQARSDESSPHEVTLSLYFLSKYEMTQGQWERFVGRNPSTYSERNWSTSWSRDGKSWSALHPVEQVSWTECMEVMSRLGLTLPSEAQWENGARGGTETPFWTGSDLESLKDAANLADAYGKSHGADAWASWEKDFDDGNTLHAEMGSYRPNPFGLHDVIGNVWEWCQDGYDTSAYQSGPKVDPVAPWTGGSVRVFRGGGFNLAASDARSAVRGNNAPDYRFNVLGLRPARVVTGSVSTSCPSDSWR
jgi:formylglycine-generating enzyme required for sulfatase activity